MADEEERIKAEKLAAAKKRVCGPAPETEEKANKKTSPDTETSKDADITKAAETASTEETAVAADSPPADVPAEEKPQEDATTETSTEQPTDQEPATAEPEAQDKRDESTESPTEPMPPAPGSPDPDAEPQPARLDTPRAGHGRAPSLSIQSKMRSSSFRKTSVSQGSHSPSPITHKSPPPSLPPLTGDGDSVHEVFRKQSMRIEDLERDNKRMENELTDATARWRKTEDQLEDLREASVDAVELREKLKEAEEKAAGVESLKEEIASLQRQNSQLQSRSHRNNSSAVPGQSESPPADLVRQLESKSTTIEAMELEISNLRAQINSQSSSNSAHENQLAALEEKVSQGQIALEKSQSELADTKQALTRASEKAMKEGVDKTSTETLIKTLEREIEGLKDGKTEAEKKIETLEKKLQAMGNLHKESESRSARPKKSDKETAVLRKKLASIENENLRLREELDRMKKRDAGGTDDDALDELEDEERQRLERRIRELEGEVFDLRRGVWEERRHELTGQPFSDENPEYSAGDAAANAFDDVDLVGGRPDHARRRSMAYQQQHSSFSTVLSSGFAAFTGGNNPNRARAGSSNPPHPHGPATRGSLELLSEENLEDEFDEAEFRRAQAEDEARKRVEWVREIKRKLRDWNSWRLDLVDSRAGAEGAGVGMGEIFEV
ncbi:hypothetical protein N7494_006837 [Penicillium frequentans]|uniref:M protein repeat protein n=1 Tax=Penicillium frequentans TaxID=3151616 RepID=A0AAD6CX68_9EURO|nr:hypothetical protein N7494_006837 [Penicillium glabrum]